MYPLIWVYWGSLTFPSEPGAAITYMQKAFTALDTMVPLYKPKNVHQYPVSKLLISVDWKILSKSGQFLEKDLWRTWHLFWVTSRVCHWSDPSNFLIFFRYKAKNTAIFHQQIPPDRPEVEEKVLVTPINFDLPAVQEVKITVQTKWCCIQ